MSALPLTVAHGPAACTVAPKRLKKQTRAKKAARNKCSLEPLGDGSFHFTYLDGSASEPFFGRSKGSEILMKVTLDHCVRSQSLVRMGKRKAARPVLLALVDGRSLEELWELLINNVPVTSKSA